MHYLDEEHFLCLVVKYKVLKVFPQSTSDLVIPRAVHRGLVWLTLRDWRWFIVGALLIANVFVGYSFFRDWQWFIDGWYPTMESQFPGSTYIALNCSIVVFPAVCALVMGVTGLAISIWAATLTHQVSGWWIRLPSMLYILALGMFWVTVAGMVVVGSYSFWQYPDEFRYGAMFGSLSAIWGLALINRFSKQEPSSRKLLLSSFLVLILFSPAVILYSLGLGTIWWGTADDPLRLFYWGSVIQ